METPELRTFLGWDKPAIELVAERLFSLLTSPDKQVADLYRRATLVVPTSGSGRRLREYMAELSKARKGKPILLPKIALAGQLLACKDCNTATEDETLAAWLHVLSEEGSDPVALYAPLIPRRPENHRERWAVAVAHKLIGLRNRLEKEEITHMQVTSLLAKREQMLTGKLNSLQPDEDKERLNLTAQRKVMQNEQLRWRTLGQLFSHVDDEITQRFPGKIPAEQYREEQVSNPTWQGQSRVLILACVPELSPQLQRYLCNLHGKDGGKVEVWVHTPEEEKSNFDIIGRPKESAWLNREINIPHAFVYANEKQEVVDNEASTIHLADDEESMAAETLRLAVGCNSREVVLSVADENFAPAIVNTFAREGWQISIPEGRNTLSTDLGSLATQLADACEARTQLPLWADKTGTLNNNNTQSLNTFIALLCNRALQQALGKNAAALISMQKHIENIRMLLLPSSETTLLQMLKELPGVDAGYKSINMLNERQNPAYYDFAASVTELLDNLGNVDNISSELRNLAKLLKKSHSTDSSKKLATGIAEQMKACAELHAHLPSERYTIELLRRRVEDQLASCPFADASRSVGDLLGWRELAYARGQRIILAAMHDGCIPEPVQEDDFLPESLCDELGIRHEKFRTARDSYLLTALLASRQSENERVDFVLARQKKDGSVLAPSSLLMRCGDELPKRARNLFAESKTPRQLPAAAPCPLRRAECSKAPIAEGELEHISIIAPGKQNPFTKWHKDKHGNLYQKSFSPSSLSTFLQCPLSFWIKNLFNIDLGNTYKENKAELESNEYGTVMHAVLDKLVAQFPDEEALHRACPAAATDSTAGINHMMAACRTIAEVEWQAIYNSSTTRNKQPITMEVQLQAIERTLKSFVTQHMKDLADGWCNVAREFTFTPTMELPNNEITRFSMNADRIDRNRDGRWRIIDYKTSNTEKKPHKIHFDELEEGEYSLFSRFMNVQGYEFGTICFGEKMYRWNDVQLPLYAYGLRHPSAEDREKLGIAAGVDMSTVVPDLLYYNLQNKTEKLAVFPLVEAGEVKQISCRNTVVPRAEALFCSAMKTVKAAILMIRDGKCLFSAESLEYKSKPFSAIVKPGTSTPRFGALTLQNDPRQLFHLPELKK